MKKLLHNLQKTSSERTIFCKNCAWKIYKHVLADNKQVRNDSRSHLEATIVSSFIFAYQDAIIIQNGKEIRTLMYFLKAQRLVLPKVITLLHLDRVFGLIIITGQTNLRTPEK
ncbi:hypothetical protein O6H91_16G052500 [Diphasiastrum complanatum]|uniref:Uncharacterized protein n=1 Tax=Diphasiastrum complanatum TaxID=34168 RepID=A0ACC2BCA8_DIPCM|nr:hypothetical protein O6H91_16G052500 [Diphasiastrum complanatum]